MSAASVVIEGDPVAGRRLPTQRGRDFVHLGWNQRLRLQILNPKIDRRLVCAQKIFSHGKSDVWLLEIASGNRIRLTVDPVRSMTPVWSRDGTQLAYYSVRSGKPVVYLKAANSMAIEQKVWEPPVSAWTRDWMLDSLMSVELQEINGLLQSTSSRSLFQTHATAATLDNYDVTPDGKGFLANIVGTDETAEPLDLVVNWTSELKK